MGKPRGVHNPVIQPTENPLVVVFQDLGSRAEYASGQRRTRTTTVQYNCKLRLRRAALRKGSALPDDCGRFPVILTPPEAQPPAG